MELRKVNGDVVRYGDVLAVRKNRTGPLAPPLPPSMVRRRSLPLRGTRSQVACSSSWVLGSSLRSASGIPAAGLSRGRSAPRPVSRPRGSLVRRLRIARLGRVAPLPPQSRRGRPGRPRSTSRGLAAGLCSLPLAIAWSRPLRHPCVPGDRTARPSRSCSAPLRTGLRSSLRPLAVRFGPLAGGVPHPGLAACGRPLAPRVARGASLRSAPDLSGSLPGSFAVPGRPHAGCRRGRSAARFARRVSRSLRSRRILRRRGVPPRSSSHGRCRARHGPSRPNMSC